VPLSGCTIDYTSYYDKYGDVVNKEDPTKGLTSSLIEDGVLSYPSDNSTFIEKYSQVYSPLASEYRVYSSYYSSKYDVLYIAYDKIDDVKNGKRIQLPCRDDMVMIVSGEEVIAAYQHVNNGIYEAKRGLW
jgi:hypothetical protein